MLSYVKKEFFALCDIIETEVMFLLLSLIYFGYSEKHFIHH